MSKNQHSSSDDEDEDIVDNQASTSSPGVGQGSNRGARKRAGSRGVGKQRAAKRHAGNSRASGSASVTYRINMTTVMASRTITTRAGARWAREHEDVVDHPQGPSPAPTTPVQQQQDPPAAPATPVQHEQVLVNNTDDDDCVLNLFDMFQLVDYVAIRSWQELMSTATTASNIFADKQMFGDIGEEWFTSWTLEDVERVRQQRRKEEEEELATMDYEQVFREW
jgi:hypothetical protein